MQSDDGRGKTEDAEPASRRTPPAGQGAIGPPGEKPLTMALSRWRGDGGPAGPAGR